MDILDALKLEQGLTDHKIAERFLLRPAQPRSKKWVDTDINLQEFINAYIITNIMTATSSFCQQYHQFCFN